MTTPCPSIFLHRSDKKNSIAILSSALPSRLYYGDSIEALFFDNLLLNHGYISSLCPSPSASLLRV